MKWYVKLRRSIVRLWTELVNTGLRQRQVGPLHGGADGQVQGRSRRHRRRPVEQGGGDFQGQQGRRRGKGQAAHQHVVVEQGFSEVERVIDQTARQGRRQTAGIAQPFPPLGIAGHQSGPQAHGPLGQEGEPALRGKDRVGQVVQGGAQAGGQAAHGPQQQPGQDAGDVGQGEGGLAGGQGDDDSGVVDGEHHRRHHGQHDQPLGGEALLSRHGTHLAVIDLRDQYNTGLTLKQNPDSENRARSDRAQSRRENSRRLCISGRRVTACA